MGFDTIPEDREESYPCECGGNITKVDGRWECDRCNKYPGNAAAEARGDLSAQKEKIVKQAILDYLGVDDISLEELRGRLVFQSLEKDTYLDRPDEGTLLIDKVALIHFGPLSVCHEDTESARTIRMTQQYKLLKPERK